MSGYPGARCRTRKPGTLIRLVASDYTFSASAAVLAIILFITIAGPWIAPHDPTALYLGQINGGSTPAHPFGTDDLGRDIFSRVLHGARASIIAPLLIVLLATACGTLLALIAAWFGGLLSGGIARVIDVIFAIPGLVLAVIAVAMFGKGLVAPVIALAIAYIPVTARLVQTAASRELGKPYLEALRVQGVSSLEICLGHLVPALLPIIVAQMAVGFGYAMLDLAAVSFLGLGAAPPSADWGSLIASGQGSILAGAPEQSFFPAALVVLTVLSVSMIGARATVWAETITQ